MQEIIGDVTKKLIDYYNKDVKRINHAMKVAAFAKSIALQEKITENELLIIEICGYLHDVGIKFAEEKYQSSAGKYQEELGPNIAKELLKDLQLEDDIVERICYIIGHHHTYDSIIGMDYQILIEADFIVNIYEDSMKQDTIKQVYHRIFKTESGKNIVNTMFLDSDELK